MYDMEINGKKQDINLGRKQGDWWFFNVIETGKDGLGHPFSEHSVPIDFIKYGGTIKTGGNTYKFKEGNRNV